MFHFSNIVRTKGDPKIVETGPSLKQPADQLARALGWFSIGLGVVEMFAPRRGTGTLGLDGRETRVRDFGRCARRARGSPGSSGEGPGGHRPVSRTPREDPA